MNAWKNRALAVGRLFVDVAPVVAGLTRASHPIAWVVAGIYVARRVYQQVEEDKPNLWPGVSYQHRCAILGAAGSAGAGVVVQSEGGVDYRRLDDVHFAADPGWCRGPTGRGVDTLPNWLWANYGRSMVVTRDVDKNLSLTADEESPTEAPSKLALEIADESCKLQRGGARVGLLIDGDPGTGKTEALRYVAERLGDRTLRACLKTVDPSDVVGIARVMKPTSVVLDDVDRGPTDVALEAVATLVKMGVAVLASSNKQASICDALLRDGRIDDHRTFGAIEPDVLERLSSGLDLDAASVDVLKGLTVATVARYVERRSALGHERAWSILMSKLKSASKDA